MTWSFAAAASWSAAGRRPSLRLTSSSPLLDGLTTEVGCLAMRLLRRTAGGEGVTTRPGKYRTIA
jgi:hypothetical protein